MEFPLEYFRAEVRDGFYVSGMLKKAWAAEIKVLTVIAEICEKYNIQWYADNGTLLGAVRHGGFIPWDDDMDICMLRDDFVKFQQVVEEELPEGYFYTSYRSPGGNTQIWDTIERVVNTNDIHIDGDFLDKNYQFPYPAGVDIFPLDFIPDDPMKLADWRYRASILRQAMAYEEKIEDKSNPEVRKLLEEIQKVFSYQFSKMQSIRYQIFRLNDDVMNMYSRKECTKAVLTPYFLNRNDHVYEISWYNYGIELPFETGTIRVPLAYDAVLRTEYGDGYGYPYRGGWLHPFPYYIPLEKILIDNNHTDIFNYHYSLPVMEYLQTKAGNEKREAEFNAVYIIISHKDQWKYVEAYLRTVEDKKIMVVSIPYYYMDFSGKPIQGYLEEIQPDNGYQITYIDYKKLNFLDLKTAEVVILDPYDDCNYTESVEPSFYVEKLKDYAGKITFITPYITDEPKEKDPNLDLILKHYAMVPGVVMADQVWVQSEEMKQSYMKRLLNSYREDLDNLLYKDELRSFEGSHGSMEQFLVDYYGQRIQVLDGLKEAGYNNRRKETLQIPEEYLPFLHKSNGEWKMITFYNPSIGAICSRPKDVLQKMKEDIQYFDNHCDEEMAIFAPMDGLFDLVRTLYPDCAALCHEVIELAQNCNGMLFDNVTDLAFLIGLSDQYLGDPDKLIWRFVEQNKKYSYLTY